MGNVCSISTSGSTVRASPRLGNLGYLPALDGLRALAVMAVVAYHLGYSAVPGGYIGVEVFFVLSGWLVCALLTVERSRVGRIDLGAFWLRRARRLLPAVGLVMAATLAVASVAEPGTLHALRGQAVAAAGYHLNWRLIVDHQSYFEAAAGPSALQHLWSLSIEEQFYIVFPLVLIAALAFGRAHRRPFAAPALALVAAVVSTVARTAWSEPGGDPSRAYFGADTRAAGLLFGVALGLVWVPTRLVPHDHRRFRGTIDAVGVAGLAVLAWYVTSVDYDTPAAFDSAFTAVDLATVAVVAVAVHPTSGVVSRALGTPPLRWIGARSYGIYLWHWPVITFTAAAPGEQPESPARVLAQITATLVLAALSYRWVERPIREHGFRWYIRQLGARLYVGVRERPLAAAGVAALAVVVVGGSVQVTNDVVTASAPSGSRTRVLISGTTTTAGIRPVAAPAGAAVARAPQPQAQAGAATATPKATPATSAPPLPPTIAAAPPAFPATTAIGDSVMVGGGPALAARMGPAVTVDALIGRHMTDAVSLIDSMARTGTLGRVVVLHLGANGPFTDAEIDAVFAAIGPDRRVVLVNVLVPRRWEGEVNAKLAAAAGRHGNATLVDWRSVATGEPGLLREDGYHLTGPGQQRYAEVIASHIPRT